MQTLYIKDPAEMKWHEAQCRNPEYAKGLSFRQHQMIRQYAREQLQSPARVESLLQAKQHLHNHWSDTTRKSNKRESSMAAKYVDLTSAKILEPNDAKPIAEEVSSFNASRLVARDEVQISEADIPEFSALSF